MISPPENCNKAKYCRFHKDHVHHIEQYNELKKSIMKGGLKNSSTVLLPSESQVMIMQRDPSKITNEARKMILPLLK